MTWKLVLNGLKGRIKDYFVLFSGLFVSSAIFYMFQSLASNHEFLRSSNIGRKSIVYTSYLGSVLLAIITLVYIFYANSFLLAMRQRVYAMYMLLGAKSRKIAQLIFLETVTIGFFAVMFGILIGLGATTVSSNFLISRMNFNIKHFSPWSLKAVIITCVFFIIIFAFVALLNAIKLVKTPVLKLINQHKTPSRINKNRYLWSIEIIFGIVLLAVGYWSMIKLNQTQFKGFFTALITIVLGTYFTFDSLFLAIVELFRKSDKFRLTKIHSFTLGELSFRLREYTRLLSTVAMLFAMALGAITVGLEFNDQIYKYTEDSTYYDLVLHDPDQSQLAKVSQFDLKDTSVYHYKLSKGKIYWLTDELDKKPYKYRRGDKIKTISGKNFLKDRDAAFHTGFGSSIPNKVGDFNEVKFADKKDFEKIQGKKHEVRFYLLKDLRRDLKKLKPIVAVDTEKNYKKNTPEVLTNQKYCLYDEINGIYSTLEFLGLFLGIAFLAMLSACLMFKILSSAGNDRGRYQMLDKIGTHKELLRSSIRREIGVLFLAPAIMGIVHVLFGLQMFQVTRILEHAYSNIWIPFLIFIILYLGYYFVTVTLYNAIVIPKHRD